MIPPRPARPSPTHTDTHTEAHCPDRCPPPRSPDSRRPRRGVQSTFTSYGAAAAVGMSVGAWPITLVVGSLFDSIEAIKAAASSCLYMYNGKDDEYVPEAMGVELYDAATDATSVCKACAVCQTTRPCRALVFSVRPSHCHCPPTCSNCTTPNCRPTSLRPR